MYTKPPHCSLSGPQNPLSDPLKSSSLVLQAAAIGTRGRVRRHDLNCDDCVMLFHWPLSFSAIITLGKNNGVGCGESCEIGCR
jgi:hypothetical protein